MMKKNFGGLSFAHWLLAIFVVALALRAISLFEIRSIPSFEHLLIDARAYDDWAQRIAAGAWWGDRVFYQAPAYPYFMAVVYALAGHDLWVLHWVQVVLGSFSCVLIGLATRRLAGHGAGVAAGLLLACYPPAIFFDGIIQKTSLALFLTTAFLALLARFQAERRATAAAAAGLMLGLLALTRENSLILLPVLPLWIALRFRDRSSRERVRWAAALLAGAALVLLPVGFRNLVVGHSFSLTTSQLGTNFWYGNNPDATGMYQPLLPGRHTPEFESPDATRLAEAELGRELSSGEVSSYWLAKGLRFVRDEPGQWLSLMLHKLLLTWNDTETPDTEDIYVYADWSLVIRSLLPLLRFGILIPLAMAGLAFAWRRDPSRAEVRRDTTLLLWLAAVYSAGVVIFLTAARFRFPLVPLLLPFAGFAIAKAGVALRAKRFDELGAPLIAFALSALVCNLPLLDRDMLRASGYLNLGGILLREGELDGAERHLLYAASIHSDDPDLQFHLATLRAEQQDWTRAERHLRRMLEMEQRDYRTHLLLARVLRAQDRLEEARKHRRLARRLNPCRPRK